MCQDRNAIIPYHVLFGVYGNPFETEQSVVNATRAIDLVIMIDSKVN